MTATPRRAAIAVRRPRNFAVGIPATVRRNPFPRLPRPIVSRPSARVGKVEALDDHRAAPRMRRDIEQGGDRRADPAITPRCRQTCGGHRDRDRSPDRIPRPVEHTAGEVIGVQVDTEHRAGAQLFDRR